MLNAELRERLEILRRIGERGLKLAQSALDEADARFCPEVVNRSAHHQHLDLWQHLLDELKRTPSGTS